MIPTGFRKTSRDYNEHPNNNHKHREALMEAQVTGGVSAGFQKRTPPTINQWNYIILDIIYHLVFYLEYDISESEFCLSSDGTYSVGPSKRSY
jgi:hypothetical protein